jgi:hypothetical protein
VWLQFLRKVSLIDDLEIKITKNELLKQVTLKVIPLGQFRKLGKTVQGEKMEIKWIRNEDEQTHFENKLTILAEKGAWQVSVKLITPHVRNDPRKLTVDTKKFPIN